MAATSLCGVTAHGSPSGPLQFGRLEAALGRRVPFQCRAKTRRAVHLDGLSPKGNTVPNNSHQRAAEFHDLAAHAHRAAAVHHGKEDHRTAHEHSKEALEYSNKAHQRSEEAIKKSANTAV